VAPEADLKPRVLMGTLDPILRVGVVRALIESGASVVDGASGADALVERAARFAPDAVVLGASAGGDGGEELRARLQEAAPGATLVIWRNAEQIEVLRPRASTPRVMSAPVPEQLTAALLGDADDEGGPCPAT
jgi:AmiR/NasT family two-component response regulator